jgi:hypothetical protein
MLDLYGKVSGNEGLIKASAIIQNPVFKQEFPDPCIITYEDKLIGYATSRVGYQNIQTAWCYNNDLNNWFLGPGALAEFPDWIRPKSGIWAPHVVYLKEENEFRIYYTGTLKINKKRMGSGVSKSKTPYEFIGNYSTIVDDNGYRAIDSCFLRDYKTSKDYLFYGSQFESIQAIELNSEGTRPAIGAKPIDIISPYLACQARKRCVKKKKCKWQKKCKWHRQYEGVFVKYHEEFQKYYLWVSTGGWQDRYCLLVFQSDNVLGPYVPLNDGSPVLRSNWDLRRPGQNIIFELNGKEIICYHAVPKNRRYVPGTDHMNRELCLDLVTYNNGVPIINHGTPSEYFYLP